MKRLALASMYTALAFIFSYIEWLLPIPMPFPGMKLGLANIVIVICLYHLGMTTALTVSLVRLMLGAFTFGNLSMLLYSLCGGMFSFFIMVLFKKINFHIYSVSAMGGIFHNIGQLLVAGLMLSSSAIINYFPFLFLSGIITGYLIGFISHMCIKRFKPLTNSMS